MTILPSALFKSTVSPGATLLLFSPLAVKFQPLLATFATSFNCETFTASVSSVPALTPVIFLSPALIPSFVTDTSPAVRPSLSKATSSPTLIPSLFITVSPVVTLRMLISLASLIFNVSSPSAITPILSSERLASSARPPLILTVVPNLRSTFKPVSPAKVRGLNACFAV